MKLSTRSKYGLRALFDMAAQPLNRPVRLRDLADRNNIPLKFLEQIFLILRHAGLVRSQVGAGGGYTLARPSTDITLGEVIRTLDGTIAPVGCISQIAYEPCTCPDEQTCVLRAVMSQVRDAIVAVVDHTTLADAVAQVRRPAKRARASASRNRRARVAR